jgi:hypothetical protein
MDRALARIEGSPATVEWIESSGQARRARGPEGMAGASGRPKIAAVRFVRTAAFIETVIQGSVAMTLAQHPVSSTAAAAADVPPKGSVLPCTERPGCRFQAPSRLRIACALALVVLCVDTSLAQSGGTFAITKSTIDSGAGASAAAPYGVRYTAGQPDAGFASGGSFAVRGGFWGSRSNPPTDAIFAHGFE